MNVTSPVFGSAPFADACRAVQTSTKAILGTIDNVRDWVDKREEGVTRREHGQRMETRNNGALSRARDEPDWSLGSLRCAPGVPGSRLLWGTFSRHCA